MKQLLKQITPPLVWNLLRSRLRPTPVAVTYEGQFQSFEDVTKNYPSATNYHSEASEEQELEEGRVKLERFESGKDAEDSVTLSRLNFLPTLITLFPGQKTSVLDVGGGFGVTFLDLKYSLPKRNISVTVLELPSLIPQGRKLFERYSGISFADSLPETDQEFDVVYFGSSLQYFEDYLEMLARVTALSPKVLVIADTTMGDADPFVAAQVNMAGRAIPRMVFNRRELEELCLSRGYELVHRSTNFSHGISFSNYESPISETRHWNLVFQRKSE